MVETNELAEMIEKKVHRTTEENIPCICAVTLAEIEKEELDFFSLLGKVKRILQYEFGINIDENTFGQALGILQGEKLVDSKISKEDIKKKLPWKLTEKGKMFLLEEAEKARATREAL